MMHFSKFAVYSLVLSLLSSTAVFAQSDKQIPYVVGADMFDKGIKAHDDGHYKQAIDYYNQIPEGDTFYLRSLYERSLSLLADSSFSKCIEVAQKAIDLHSKDRRLLLFNIANALDDMGKSEQALKLYDSLTHLYPYDYKPYFEQAIIKFRAKDYKASEQFLQQSLLIHPQHFRSHYLLGSMYMMQGRQTEAILALSASLLCTSEVEQAKNPIAFLAQIATQSDEVAEYYSNRNPDNRDPAFDEIDEIVHAKVALDRGYELKTDLNDNIFRQLQVVMEKITYDAKDPNFAMQYYVPLYAQIYKEEQFEPFALLLFSGYGIKVVEKAVDSRKGKTRMEEIKKMVFPYLTNIASTKVLNYEERRKAPEKYHFYREENNMAIGEFSNKEEHKFAAGTVLFYQNETLGAEGNYNANGKKEGTWKYYHPLGGLRLIEEVKDGKVAGEATAWYESGIMKSQTKYDNEGEETELKEYSEGGILESLAVKKAKDEYEYTFYYPSGSVRKKSTFLKGKMKDGKTIVYFENGVKQKDFNYKNEEYDGAFITYYENGQIDEKAIYADGKLNGAYLSYFEDGQLAETSNYVDGFEDGEHIEYRYDGSLYFKKNFKKGKADGEAIYYNNAGKPFGTVVYKNDRIISTKFMKPDGTVASSSNSDNAFANIYNQYGILSRKVPIDDRNKVNGKATYFFPWGGMREATNFKNDRKDGASVFYYQNGNTSITRQYKGDTSDGYYRHYSDYGNLLTEGWMKNDESEGVWHNYNSNGNLSREFYLLDGELNGPEKNYELNGKLDYVVQYDKGLITGLTQYDSTGKVMQELSFDKGIGKYKTLHLNGTPAFQCEVKHGALNGTYTIHDGNKVLQEKGNYINGKLDGAFESYAPNNKLRVSGNYRNGEKDKTWTYFDFDGKPESIWQYKNGNLEGADSSFNSGILRSVTHYHNDDLHGTYTVYGDGGKIAGVLYYDLGTLIGFAYEDKDGKLTTMQEVKNGAAHIQTTYANGAKALDWNYDKNVRQGMQKLYYSNGKLAEEMDYDKGCRVGVYNQFNPDGSKYCESTYKNDEKDGVNKYYDTKGRLIFVVNFECGLMHGKAQWTDAAGKTIDLVYYYGALEK